MAVLINVLHFLMFYIFPVHVVQKKQHTEYITHRDTTSFGSIYAFNLFDKEYEGYNITTCTSIFVKRCSVSETLIEPETTTTYPTGRVQWWGVGHVNRMLNG